MAKPSDLLGKTGGAGFGAPVNKPVVPIVTPPAAAEEGEKQSKFQPPKDARPAKGGGGPTGGAPVSVRPKV